MRKKKEKLYYLAHPYTPKSKMTASENVFKCVRIANELMDKGYHIYAPIVMTHWFHAFKYREYEFWVKEDFIMMERCDGIILAGDWEKSSGCLAEKKWFEENKKEVIIL